MRAGAVDSGIDAHALSRSVNEETLVLVQQWLNNREPSDSLSKVSAFIKLQLATDLQQHLSDEEAKMLDDKLTAAGKTAHFFQLQNFCSAIQDALAVVQSVEADTEELEIKLLAWEEALRHHAVRFLEALPSDKHGIRSTLQDTRNATLVGCNGVQSVTEKQGSRAQLSQEAPCVANGGAALANHYVSSQAAQHSDLQVNASAGPQRDFMRRTGEVQGGPQGSDESSLHSKARLQGEPQVAR